ncbi:hypothetical protein E2C01_066584 [Portunus trituberculatus]|uniref:Uncharacterized protein n=1 Tax=Portunus trituberculatus TaxID=210409 RepID=A0A5B7HRD0_PORTR|nr:hypothetical protein [Portunus trituberculatus]
MNSGGVGLK